MTTIQRLGVALLTLLAVLSAAGCGFDDNAAGVPSSATPDDSRRAAADGADDPDDGDDGSGTADNPFSPDAVEEGEAVAGMRIESIGPYEDGARIEPNLRVTFSGEATLRGRYHRFGTDDGLHPDMVRFDVDDEEQLAKLPRLADDSDEQDGVRFFFANQDQAREAFGPAGSTGQATVVITDYVIERYPSDGAANRATLVDVDDTSADEPAADDAPDTDARDAADRIAEALKQQDMAQIADHVHPDSGVRFSPYAYVDVDEDVVMGRDEVAGAMDEDDERVWGTWDGKGGPIELSFAEYYEQFIWDVDFAQADEVTVDEHRQHGNMINNAEEAYPQATIVEYYYAGNGSEHGEMGWRALRLALEPHEGDWHLVGVIHSEWTI